MRDSRSLESCAGAASRITWHGGGSSPAKAAADSGMNTAGYSLTAGLVLLTMNGPEAYLRLALAWKDDVGNRLLNDWNPKWFVWRRPRLVTVCAGIEASVRR